MELWFDATDDTEHTLCSLADACNPPPLPSPPHRQESVSSPSFQRLSNCFGMSVSQWSMQCVCVCVCQTGSLTGGITAVSGSTVPLERKSEHMFTMNWDTRQNAWLEMTDCDIHVHVKHIKDRWDYMRGRERKKNKATKAQREQSYWKKKIIFNCWLLVRPSRYVLFADGKTVMAGMSRSFHSRLGSSHLIPIKFQKLTRYRQRGTTCLEVRAPTCTHGIPMRQLSFFFLTKDMVDQMI